MPAVKDLTNNPTFRGIEEPVALYFSYVDIDKYDYYEQNKKELKNLKNTCKEELVNILRKNGYLVVTDNNPLAADPGMMVVSDTGIQTPFLHQKKLKGKALNLMEDINDSQIARVRSYIFAVRLSQLPRPAPSTHPVSTPFEHLRHPDPKMIEKIEHRYGKNFIENMLKRAWSWGNETAARLKETYDIKNLNQPLYTGKGLTVEPFYCFARNDLESRYVIFATADYADAVRYSYKKERKFGLIHMYQKASGQKFYGDFWVELGMAAARRKADKVETLVVPGVNEYLGLEIYMGERSFKVPAEDSMWKVFLEYYRGGYMPRNDNPYMIQRRLNILEEAALNNGTAVCHSLFDSGFGDLMLTQTIETERFNQSIKNMTERVKDIKQEGKDLNPQKRQAEQSLPARPEENHELL